MHDRLEEELHEGLRPVAPETSHVLEGPDQIVRHLVSAVEAVVDLRVRPGPRPHRVPPVRVHWGPEVVDQEDPVEEEGVVGHESSVDLLPQWGPPGYLGHARVEVVRWTLPCRLRWTSRERIFPVGLGKRTRCGCDRKGSSYMV